MGLKIFLQFISCALFILWITTSTHVIYLQLNANNSFSYRLRALHEFRNSHRGVYHGRELAELKCMDVKGHPDESMIEDMVYWSDIPSDSKYRSPFYDKNKYLTFEPDHGGWNNIRMAMETVLVMAHAMGRTLVLPPENKMYLLTQGILKQKTDFSFNDFFDLEALSMEHDGLEIITMEEFLSRKEIPGLVLNPPNNRVNWNGLGLKPLWNYLRDVGEVRIWDPRDCMVAFPSSTDRSSLESLELMMEDINNGKYGPIPKPEDYAGKPVPVDASTVERYRESMSERTKLCMYDEKMQNAPLVHFKDDAKEKVRLLTHFYGFIFFQDWRQDLWTKRFVRDHVKYHDEIICTAGRIIQAVRDRARSRDPEGNPQGLFDSFHIRRGDFQYKKTRVDANVIYDISKNELKEGATIYIATDERDKSFFKPLSDHYDLVFLDDFSHLFSNLNTNYYGMLDQLVCTKSRVFFGTWFSTFSGYINRLRGYYIEKNKLDGYKDGTMESWYFAPEEKRDEMQMYRPVRKPFYIREFPTSWREIDKGISEISNIALD